MEVGKVSSNLEGYERSTLQQKKRPVSADTYVDDLSQGLISERLAFFYWTGAPSANPVPAGRIVFCGGWSEQQPGGEECDDREADQRQPRGHWRYTPRKTFLDKGPWKTLHHHLTILFQVARMFHDTPLPPPSKSGVTRVLCFRFSKQKTSTRNLFLLEASWPLPSSTYIGLLDLSHSCV